MLFRASTIVALCLVLAACAASQDESGTLSVRASGNPSTADMERAQEIITLRLKEFVIEPAASFKSRIVDNTIRFTFYGFPPTEATVTQLASTPGKFTLALTNMASDVWVSDADVEEAQIFETDKGATMRVRLSDAAGKRLLEKTSSHIGRQVRASWDGKTLVVATIQSPFGPGLQFDAPAPPEGMFIRVMLQYGRLPITVDTAEYQAVSRR